MLSVLEKNISDFVSSKTLNFFERLGIDGSIFKKGPFVWENSEEYSAGKITVKSLKVVNDCAERSVKLMQDYHGLITGNEEHKIYALQVIQRHRQLYPDCSRKTLKRKFDECG